jgi:hypothetical protein
MAAQHPKLASDSLEKIPDNIAVSFLPNFESLSKRALEKGLNYFTQGYIHDIKISEAHGTMRVDARCWRSMRKSQDPHNLHDKYQYVVDQHVLSVYVVIIHIRVHDPLCRMDNGIYCLSFELALKLYERKTTKFLTRL